jgi:competence CoiA-like predicted nuclease
MFYAIYKDKVICSMDTKNIYDNYESEVYDEFKSAGQAGLLKCTDCGTQVFLKAGNHKVPHFAHKKANRNCNELNKNETEEQKKGKFILYKWLKSQYENVYVDKRYENRIANVSLESNKGIIAFQYIRNERSLLDWHEKKEDYIKHGILDIYFFSFKEFCRVKNISEEQFIKIVQKYSNDNTIKMLDTDKNEIHLMRYIDFNDKEGKLFYSELFSKSYNIFNINITVEGKIESDFENEYLKAYEMHREIARKKYREMLDARKKYKEMLEEKYKAKEFRKQLIIHQEISNIGKVNGISNQLVKTNIIESENEIKHNIENQETNLISKYFNPDGFTYEELDDDFKQITLDFPEREWHYKGLRWVLCKRCRKYYLVKYCWSFGGLKEEATLGICNNCAID